MVDKKSVAFFGLGLMGQPMAANLVKAGFNVRGFDIDEQRRKSAAAIGVPIVDHAPDAVTDAAFVVMMLPDTLAVERCLMGSDGIEALLKPGCVVIDMSTISPVATRAIAARLTQAGKGFVDAPVSGGVDGARAATLSIMVGGANQDVERARSVLDALGKKVTHIGPAGSGQAVKLCNQVVVALSIQAVCEALMLATALGINLERATEAFANGAADSWVLRKLAPRMLARDESAGFRIGLQYKDLLLAREVADVTRTPLPGLEMVATLYREAIAHGEADNGNQALFRVYERLTNLTLASQTSDREAS